MTPLDISSSIADIIVLWRLFMRSCPLTAPTTPPAVHDAAALAAVLSVLADPTRLAILSHLRGGEHRVGELADHLAWPSPRSPSTSPFCAEPGSSPPTPTAAPA